MIGIGEVVIGAVWRLIPHRLRVSIATRIALLQSRTLEAVPRSRTVVVAAGVEARERFGSVPVVAPPPEAKPRAYSLLTTCYNEAETITDFLDSVLRQEAAPAELIITDGGSVDGTLQLITQWESKHQSSLPFRLQVISAGRVNIAKGRNLAAGAALEQVFLFADAGTTLDRAWAKRLLGAFAIDPAVEVVCGWYKPIAPNLLQRAVAEFVVPRWDALDPETFLPSARSLAVSRAAFERAGGFPEFLTRAGEDSLFDYYLKSSAPHWAFVPEALAFWRLPSGPAGLFNMVQSYSRGDAELPVLFESIT